MTQYHSLTFILFLLQGNVHARHSAVTTEWSSTDFIDGILSCRAVSYRISKYRDLNQDSDSLVLCTNFSEGHAKRTLPAGKSADL